MQRDLRTQAEALARDLGVPYSIVRRWRDMNRQLLAPAPTYQQTHDEIGQLLTTYVWESIVTLVEMARFMRSEVWLHARTESGGKEHH